MKRQYDFSKAKRGPLVPKEPGKTRVTIRLDNDVIEHFQSSVDRAGGGNYQTQINDALRDHIRGTRLETIVRQAIRKEVRAILPAELPAKLLPETSKKGVVSMVSLNDAVREIERDLLGKALKATQGNVHRAADLLGVSRYTVSRMLTRYNLKVTSRDSSEQGEGVRVRNQRDEPIRNLED